MQLAMASGAAIWSPVAHDIWLFSDTIDEYPLRGRRRRRHQQVGIWCTIATSETRHVNACRGRRH
jgi:hypothetical protein